MNKHKLILDLLSILIAVGIAIMIFGEVFIGHVVDEGKIIEDGRVVGSYSKSSPPVITMVTALVIFLLVFISSVYVCVLSIGRQEYAWAIFCLFMPGFMPAIHYFFNMRRELR